ncbi:MAG: hypothetical protein RDV48_19995 [Candidatus Eremiobacteraeota bacterium]|nr:hypothetical protein [Candidatus Eremiobacteraeota bacterium]
MRHRRNSSGIALTATIFTVMALFALIFFTTALAAGGQDINSPQETLASGSILWSIQPSGGGTPQVTMEQQYCTSFMGFLRFYSRASTMTLKFTLPEDTFEGYSLQMTDAGSNALMEIAKQEGNKGIWSPLTIRVNESVIAENISIVGTAEETRTYQIGRYLRKGPNTISFSLGGASRTRYDLKSVSLLKN